MFRRRFWLHLALAVPVLLTSGPLPDLLGYTATFPGAQLIAPVLGTVIFFHGGWVFLTGGLQEARDREPGMMLLIAMAISVAFVASVATELGLIDLEFWWELAGLVVVMLLGHWQEMKALGQARGALDALAALLPDEAVVLRDGQETTVSLDELSEGDLVLVRPGQRVPADGTVESGSAEVDESMITGESNPVTRGEGDRVVAGTVPQGSSLRVTVDAVGDDTTLAGIQRLVEEAQTSSSRVQSLADRAAAALFYVATGAAAITFVAWLVFGTLPQAITRTVTVLVVSCPHAFGLAIPLVIALSTSLSAREGILIKDRMALEGMRRVDAVLFDKTGTLTKGEHVVSEVATAEGTDTATLLRLAAGVEGDSEHPLARAIVARAEQEDVTPATAEGFEAEAGRGVSATVEGRTVRVGGPAMLRELDLSAAGGLAEAVEGWTDRGAAVISVVDDGTVIGAFALEDEVRPESRQAVAALKDAGVRVVMITGDAQQVADRVGQELGLDEVMAEVLPEDKDAKVRELQDRGLRVAMVGDGVNDAPALARADVGIAIGAGTDVAIESAGVVLATGDPRAVLGVRTLSEASYRKSMQNIAWAVGYNVLGIPLAAGVLAPIGFVMPPAVAAGLMSVSTIVVALNAQLLRRLDLSPDAVA